jgi:hypothetical protein
MLRRYGNMRAFNYFSVLLLLLLAATCMASDEYVSDVKLGDKVTVVGPGSVTKLCPYPDCRQGQHVTRIPEGTVLKVEGMMDVKYGDSTMKWFETTYKEKRGWISIHDTDLSE